jgi:hypothetical protein
MPDIRTILADLCVRAGFPDTDIALDRVSGRVEGMVITNRASVRSSVEAITRAFLLDAVESDGRVRFSHRPTDIAAEIGESDLVPIGGGENGAGASVLAVTRLQEGELPRRVDVVYLSRATDWQRATQSACREVVASENATTVELPLGLTDTQARRMADALLYDAWVSRDSFAFHLSSSFARLEPGDVVRLTARGTTRDLRLLRIESDLLTLRCEAVLADPAVLISDSVAGAPHAILGRMLALADTVLFLLDLPPLRDPDDGPGYYAAASFDAAAGGRWRGAVLYVSSDADGTFNTVATVPGPATWGFCQTTLATGSGVTWDRANRLTVALRNGELESRSETAVLNGANAAVVGGEIIQFVDATLVGPATYELSTLLRGRRGTEQAIGTHAADETFLLLSEADLVRVSTNLASIGRARSYKAATLGQTLDAVTPVEFTNTGNSLRPFSPAHVRGSRDAPTGDWTITWVRRTRIAGEWRDGADVPLVEDEEAYEIDIFDGEGAVRRTIATVTPQASYTAAQQEADFGTLQTSLRLRVIQISATIGRGQPREVNL